MTWTVLFLVASLSFTAKLNNSKTQDLLLHAIAYSRATAYQNVHWTSDFRSRAAQTKWLYIVDQTVDNRFEKGKMYPDKWFSLT